jgi:tetratricopeptide (TPR) repeat protein
MGAAAWHLLERLNFDRPVRGLVWLLQPVWRPLASLFGFAYAWLATRPYKQLVWGVPALFLLLPIAAAALWGITWGRESAAAQYRQVVREARDAHDYEAVQMFERKLDQLGVDTARSDFQAAVKLAEAGARDEAYAQMRLLAPEEEAGYPGAHYWILVRLLSGELDLAEDERLRLAGVHLKHLQTLGAKGVDIDALHAIYLEQTGQLEAAAKLLEPHVNRLELAAVQRLQIDLKLNRLDEARRDARALDEHLEQARRKGEAFDSQRYQGWVQAQQVLGDQAAWARLVRQWFTIDPKNPIVRQNVVALDQMEFGEILQSTHPSGAELAARLSEAVQLAPDPAQLEPQIEQLYNMRRQSPAVDEMFKTLMDAATSPAPLVASLGALAAKEGDIPLARRLLARAVKEMPDHAVAWNNYAWALAHEPDQQLNAALAAVNRALELAPSEFHFRETRGQVLLDLGRWDEAIDDLEFALNGMPDEKAVHLALATAYEHLGQAELAQIHRQQAQ